MIYDKIKNDYRLRLKFFKCKDGETVHGATCLQCNGIESCKIVKEIIDKHERAKMPSYQIKLIRRYKMEFLSVKKDGTAESMTSIDIEKKKIAAGTKFYQLKSAYEVQNKLVSASKAKQMKLQDLNVYDPSTGQKDKVSNMALKPGSTVYEIGEEFIVVTRLVKKTTTKRRRKRNASNSDAK